jgi:hypothetical protein
MRWLIVCVLCLLELLAPPAASAADVRIFRSPQPPPEDAELTFTVSGSGSGAVGETEAIAEVRPVGGLPCAATPAADPGESALRETVGIPFNGTARYTPLVPGDHLACAWLIDGADRVIAGPASEIIHVRPPQLQLSFDVARRVRPGSTVTVGVDYSSEVERQLVVAFAPGSGCDVSPDALLRAVGSLETVASLANVIGRGSMGGAALAGSWGQFVVCGYLLDPADGTLAASQLVASAPVQAGGPRRRCHAVGGRRRITQVAVGGISCERGRSIARRWGRARRAPRSISDLACERRTDRSVVCAGYQGEVTFRYGR